MRNQGRASQRRVFAASLLCVLVLATGLSPRPALAQSSLVLQPLVSGLASPTAITTAGDGSGRLFITLQGGTIKLFGGSTLQTFLDISSLVSLDSERGLLSTAFHPQYSSNGFFYVNYTNTAGDTVIARYRVSADPSVADPASAVILLTIAQPFDNHNGGQLQFGPDGYLYIGMGDGGSAGDPGNRAQDLGQLLGKLLRIDVNSAAPYAIPPTNPFVGTPGARGEIWAYGLRNPWRFSFDRLTGDLFIADVGQSSREEVDFQPVNSTGGQNYGWRRMEGTACFNPSSGCNDGTLTLPIIEYDHSLGCSITGGYRYRGTGSPSLFATYLFGDYCSGRIWGATEAGGGVWTMTQLLGTSLKISTFGEDETGELLVAHYDAVNGAIYRIAVVALTVSSVAPAQGAPGTAVPVTVTGTGFAAGATMSIGTGITVSNVNVGSSTQLTATLTIASGAALGPRDVTVTNSSGGSATLTGGFTVSPPGPVTLTATPATIAAGQSSVLTLVTPTLNYHNIFINGVRPACVVSGTTFSCTLTVSPTTTTTYQAAATNSTGTPYTMPSVTVVVP
jgi:glucose/arabinose dehydrogenase